MSAKPPKALDPAPYGQWSVRPMGDNGTEIGMFPKGNLDKAYKVQVVDRIVRPRREPGIDHGADRWVIAKQGDLELVWMPGHSYWRDMMEPNAYAPGSLQLLRPSQYGSSESTMRKFHEGGRLTPAVLAAHWEMIDPFFGYYGLTALLKPRKTVIVPPRRRDYDFGFTIEPKTSVTWMLKTDQGRVVKGTREMGFWAAHRALEKRLFTQYWGVPLIKPEATDVS